MGANNLEEGEERRDRESVRELKLYYTFHDLVTLVNCHVETLRCISSNQLVPSTVANLTSRR